jgi:hypothetical protein
MIPASLAGGGTKAKSMTASALQAIAHGKPQGRIVLGAFLHEVYCYQNNSKANPKSGTEPCL